MKGRVGILSSARHAVVVTIAFALLLGTTWAGRAPAFHATVDPALHEGDVALIQVRHGTAWTVATELAASGATDVLPLDSIDVVTARITTQSLAKIASDPAVRTATTDTGVAATSGPKDKWGKDLDGDDDGTELASPGPLAINAPRAWPRSTGAGIVVALLDSGIDTHHDLAGKVVARVNFVNDNTLHLDPSGHGTHLAGVVAGNGKAFKGVAPGAKLVSLRVLNTAGTGQLKDVLRAFDWLLKNRTAYNVRVANVSFGAPEARSYHDDLLSAVVESAHFAGITVVVAAGNNGPGARTLTTPGSDPFVITAGSFDDQGTVAGLDDRESSFSSRGPSIDGFAKPDVLAPGRRVLSLRAKGATIEVDRPDRLAKDDIDGHYIRMTGTSVSAAMVSGVAALVLAAHPDYTPTKVKGAIAASGRAVAGSVTPAVDAAKALSAMKDVNVKLAPSKLLLKRLTELGVGGSGTTWEGVTWEGVSWESVTWETVTWETVSWEGVIWEAVSWE